MNKQLVKEIGKQLKRKRSAMIFDGGQREIAPEKLDERESEVEEKAQVEIVSTLSSHLEEREHKTLRDIEVALERLEVGAYGICQSCGDEIKPERLKALPTAVLCIDCANDKEKKTRSGGSSELLNSGIDSDRLEEEI
jgi:DnaK suppressor protein